MTTLDNLENHVTNLTWTSWHPSQIPSLPSTGVAGVLTSRAVLAVAEFARALSGAGAARPGVGAVGFLDAFSFVASRRAGGIVRDSSGFTLAVGGTLDCGILSTTHEQHNHRQQTSGKSKAKHVQEGRRDRDDRLRSLWHLDAAVKL